MESPPLIGQILSVLLIVAVVFLFAFSLKYPPNETKVAEISVSSNAAPVLTRSPVTHRLLPSPTLKDHSSLYLSVIVTARNCSRKISPALQEIRNFLIAKRNPSPEKTFEIIFIDDSSTDGTADVVATLSDSIPEIILIQAPMRCGSCQCFKLGAYHCRGKIIFYYSLASLIPLHYFDLFEDSLASCRKMGKECIVVSVYGSEPPAPDTTLTRFLKRCYANLWSMAGIDGSDCERTYTFMISKKAALWIVPSIRMSQETVDLESLFIAGVKGMEIGTVSISEKCPKSFRRQPGDVIDELANLLYLNFLYATWLAKPIRITK